MEEGSHVSRCAFFLFFFLDQTCLVGADWLLFEAGFSSALLLGQTKYPVSVSPHLKPFCGPAECLLANGSLFIRTVAKVT